MTTNDEEINSVGVVCICMGWKLVGDKNSRIKNERDGFGPYFRGNDQRILNRILLNQNQ